MEPNSSFEAYISNIKIQTKGLPQAISKEEKITAANNKNNYDLNKRYSQKENEKKMHTFIQN